MFTLSHKVSSGIALALAACFNDAAAQEPLPLQEKVHFFTYENDSKFMTDRFYTSGVQFSVKRSSDNRGEFARKLTHVICGWTGCNDSRILTIQYNLGQLIYTPRDIRIRAPQPLDRPWAGLLYYEQVYTVLSPDQRILTTITGQVGATGKVSLAEPAQKAIHHLLDRPQPQGWDNQIGGSLAVLASAEQRTAREALSFDLPSDVRLNTATYWRLAAGTIQTYAAAGVAVVVGKDLPIVSPPPPGIGNTIMAGEARKGLSKISCLVSWIQCSAFGSIEGRLVAYNVFLDGRAFSDDPRVKRRTFVHDLVLGSRFDFPRSRNASHGPWFLQLKVTRRSPEFRSSIPVPSHRVAAVTFGTEF